MYEPKNRKHLILIILSVSLITASLTAVFLNGYYVRKQFDMLGAFCKNAIKIHPDAEGTILKVIKEKDFITEQQDFLDTYGYRPQDFSQNHGRILGILGMGFLTGVVLLFFVFFYWNKKVMLRLGILTEYLEKMNTGSQGVLVEASESHFSKLQDEIYKTVTMLYQTRDAAVTAKYNYAKNLSNIAHQLKTPITTLSLSAQMIKETHSFDYLLQIEQQLNRLTYLEEALLLLSRIDAGTLPLQRTASDVFTMLTLAADNLQALCELAGISIDIPEIDEIVICADSDWTMEAIMNLMKNCIEHSEAGMTVHCSVESNPLYVQMKVWDEGEGFAKEDIPHLFERFYRGKTAKNDSIGIGLALAKEIIEMQYGILSAYNRATGGACFDIRFYSH